MKPENKRRIVLIDTRFQLRLAGAFLLVQVLLTGLFSFGLYLFLDSEVQAGLASAHASYRSLEQMLLPIILVLAAFNLVLSAAIVTGFVVLLSHRIAGPLFRFRSVLEDLAERKIGGHTGIRPEDQLSQVSMSLGKAVRTLASDLSALSEVAVDLRQAAAFHKDPALESVLARLSRLLDAWH